VEIGGGFAQARPAKQGYAGRSLPEVRLGWNHLLVEDAHDTNAARLRPVKDDVLALFVPAKT
jgi:hypothetical protein